MVESPLAAERGVDEPAGWRSRLLAFLLGRPLSDCIDAGRDNFLVLRLLAALMVLFGHSYAVIGRRGLIPDPINQFFPRTLTHLVGVMMFFVISGFLITLSYQRRPDLLRFLRARALRVWPALIVCVGLCAFVLGPLLTSLPLSAYFGSGDTYTFFLRDASIFAPQQPALPGVFTAQRIHHVNASLWTIPYESKLYLCVAGFGVLGLLRFAWIASAAIIAILSVVLLWPLYSGTPATALFGLVLVGFFGAGAIACLLRRHVPVSTGLMLLIVAFAWWVRAWTHGTPFMWLAITYFVFWFAYVPRLPRMPDALDLSYGTYLWAFPTQQIVASSLQVTDPLVLSAIVTPIVLAIASMSWILIERPALRLKSTMGRRRTRASIAARV